MSSFVSYFTSSIAFAAVILYGCLGETLSQKSGSLNLGVPGIMLLGAIGSLVGVFWYERSCANPVPFLCFLLSLGGCLLFALSGGFIYCLLTITLKANQNVTGLTLTIFGNGVAKFVGGYLTSLAGGVGNVSMKTTMAFFRSRLPFFSTDLGIVSQLFFSYGFMVYLVVVLAFILNRFLNRTRAGLNLRAVGENPATADACGINVSKNKWMASLVGSVICGLGGLYYIMDYVSGTWTTDGTLEALGWLSLALVIFSFWKPIRAIFGSVIFGLCYWVYLYMPAFINKVLAKLFNITNATYLQNIYRVLPYLVTLIVLIAVSKGKHAVHAPTSLGQNYFREER